MRLTAFVLLFLNVAIAFAQLFADAGARSSERIAERELHPEKVKIIRVGEAHRGDEAQASVKSEHSTSARRANSRACLAWSGILPKDVDRFGVLLNSFDATYKPVAVKPPEHHWVHIPGIKTAEAAEDIASQLRTAGERGFAVLREAGQGTYQISLGVFRSEDSARRQGERFARLGAVVTPHGTPRTIYVVEGAVGIIEKIAAAAPEFEQTTVEAVDCPGVRAS